MAIYSVIGLGQLGEAVARYLAQQGAEVIAIDTQLQRVEQVKEHVARALCMDATDERALRAAGISECDTVVLALGEEQLEEAVLTTMLLRELGVGRIVSRAARDVQGKVLERLGVSEVVFPEREMGITIARRILAPQIRELLPLGGDSAVAEVRVPERLVDKTLAEAQIRRRFGLNVIAIKRRSDRVDDDGTTHDSTNVDNHPGAETRMQHGDLLVVAGTDEQIRAFGVA